MRGKTAIVTGGSSGIGRCTAIALSQAGCKVYEFSRRTNPIDGVTHIGVDVTDENSIAAAIDQITVHNGRVDILVNCAIWHESIPADGLSDQQAKCGHLGLSSRWI